MIGSAKTSLREGLTGNLVAGFKAAVGSRIDLDRFTVNADQAVALMALALALELLLDRWLAGGLAEFDYYGLTRQGSLVLCALLAVWLVARMSLNKRLNRGRRQRYGLRLLVMLAASLPVFLVAQGVLSWSWYQSLSDSDYLLLYGIIAALFAMTVLRIVHAALALQWPAAIGATMMLLALALVPHHLLDYGSVWYEGYEESSIEPLTPPINVEDLFYAQPARVEQALDAVEPGRPGIVDLYFVGFGSWASQDVFMREIGHADALLAERFDTAGRSVSLVNNTASAERLPIASLSNLRLVLKGIAERMDKDEDILLLYLTSHGSADHELGVEFWPLRLNSIQPQQLRAALDDAGIRWRAVIVSACYAGGFIAPLASDESLVMAAAAADKQSFGCANENEYTYFGRALFADSLSQQWSLPVAFEQARELVDQRERAEGNEPSQPEMRLGEAMRAQLLRLEQRLTELHH